MLVSIIRQTNLAIFNTREKLVPLRRYFHWQRFTAPLRKGGAPFAM